MPLDPPPRDAQGEVIPHDHAGIGPDNGVIRRISSHHIVSDPRGPNGKRISTMAFEPSSGRNGGLSVDLQRLIEEAGLDPRTFVINPPFIGAVRFSANVLRNEGFRIGFDPKPPDNPYHGEVWGDFTKSKKDRLRSLAEEFVRPPSF